MQTQRKQGIWNQIQDTGRAGSVKIFIKEQKEEQAYWGVEASKCPEQMNMPT